MHNEHCPIVSGFVDATLEHRPAVVADEARMALMSLRDFEVKRDRWQPVLNTRAYVTVILCLSDLLARVPEGSVGAVSSLGWQELIHGDLGPVWEAFLEPLYLAKGEWYTLGQPRDTRQINVGKAKRGISYVEAIQPLLTSVRLLVTNRLIWPPLPIGAQLTKFLYEVGSPAPYYVTYVKTLLSITKETEDIWRSQRVSLSLLQASPSVTPP